ncbi:hypothetical protein BLNAU_9229 [Blattamonas nauphoetae]|uniref:NUA/TPR/MLP1-2-like domain-containing protein n=1 Tax=Blattamonas nauphoetae TaxID=2049346 RepID=A0ABQ9XWM2_9EUKA|nr:hypothetical protein BLNAU_9229 [Blattamonas nauphoetae]
MPSFRTNTEQVHTSNSSQKPHPGGKNQQTPRPDLNSQREISDKLVSFTDIQELQQNNVELLAQIRRLQERLSKCEQDDALAKRVSNPFIPTSLKDSDLELMDQTELALSLTVKESQSIIQKIQFSQKKQAIIVAGIVHERDICRNILNAHGIPVSNSDILPDNPIDNQFDTIDSNLLRIQNSFLQSQIAPLEAEAESLQTKIHTLEMEQGQLIGEKKSLQNDISVALRQNEQYKEMLEQKNKTIAEMQASLDKSAAQSLADRAEVSNETTRRLQAENELHIATAQQQQLSQENARLKSINTSLEETLKNARSEQLAKDSYISSLNVSLSKYTSQITDTQAQSTERQNQIASLLLEKQSLQSEIASLNSTLKLERVEHGEIVQKLTDSHQHTTSEQESSIQTTKQRIEELESQLRVATEQNESLTKQVSQFRRDMEEMSAAFSSFGDGQLASSMGLSSISAESPSGLSLLLTHAPPRSDQEKIKSLQRQLDDARDTVQVQRDIISLRESENEVTREVIRKAEALQTETLREFEEYKQLVATEARKWMDELQKQAEQHVEEEVVLCRQRVQEHKTLTDSIREQGERAQMQCEDLNSTLAFSLVTHLQTDDNTESVVICSKAFLETMQTEKDNLQQKLVDIERERQSLQLIMKQAQDRSDTILQDYASLVEEKEKLAQKYSQKTKSVEEISSEKIRLDEVIEGMEKERIEMEEKIKFLEHKCKAEQNAKSQQDPSSKHLTCQPSAEPSAVSEDQNDLWNTILFLRLELSTKESQLSTLQEQIQTLMRKCAELEGEAERERQKLTLMQESSADSPDSTTSLQASAHLRNELSIFRESNRTLRTLNMTQQAENTELLRRLDEAEDELRTKEKEIHSLQASLSVALVERQNAEKEMVGWKERVESSLKRYHGLDMESEIAAEKRRKEHLDQIKKTQQLQTELNNLHFLHNAKVSECARLHQSLINTNQAYDAKVKAFEAELMKANEKLASSDDIVLNMNERVKTMDETVQKLTIECEKVRAQTTQILSQKDQEIQSILSQHSSTLEANTKRAENAMKLAKSQFEKENHLLSTKLSQAMKQLTDLKEESTKKGHSKAKNKDANQSEEQEESAETKEQDEDEAEVEEEEEEAVEEVDDTSVDSTQLDQALMLLSDSEEHYRLLHEQYHQILADMNDTKRQNKILTNRLKKAKSEQSVPSLTSTPLLSTPSSTIPVISNAHPFLPPTPSEFGGGLKRSLAEIEDNVDEPLPIKEPRFDENPGYITQAMMHPNFPPPETPPLHPLDDGTTPLSETVDSLFNFGSYHPNLNEVMNEAEFDAPLIATFTSQTPIRQEKIDVTTDSSQMNENIDKEQFGQQEHHGQESDRKEEESGQELDDERMEKDLEEDQKENEDEEPQKLEDESEHQENAVPHQEEPHVDAAESEKENIPSSDPAEQETSNTVDEAHEPDESEVGLKKEDSKDKQEVVGEEENGEDEEEIGEEEEGEDEEEVGEEEEYEDEGEEEGKDEAEDAGEEGKDGDAGEEEGKDEGDDEGLEDEELEEEELEGEEEEEQDNNEQTEE